METHPCGALRRQRLEEAKRGATEKSLMYMAWGRVSKCETKPKASIKTILYEIVEFVDVCFQAISRWPSNDFRW